jgi:hypothetical protein
MNYPIVVAGVLVGIAFLAHTIVGTREALGMRPDRSADTGEADREVERHWVQSFCAFHLVTVDLLVLTALLLTLGATDLVPARRTVSLAMAGLFGLWGLAWLVTLLALRRPRREFGLLSQWVLWFVCAGLLTWGAGSL